MDVKNFRTYLENTYRSASGKPVSRRTAVDYASRCKRLEGLLGIDLDHNSMSPDDMRRCVEQLPNGTLNNTAKDTVLMAARRYHAFRQKR